MPPTRPDSRQRPPLSQSATRLAEMRSGLQHLFTGRSTVGTSRQPDLEEVQSPKTPVLSFGEHELPSTRIRIPGLTRSGTLNSVRSNSQRSSRASDRAPQASERAPPSPSPLSQAHVTPLPVQHATTNDPAAGNNNTHVRSDSRFVGVDPAEAELAALAQTGRRRRMRKNRIVRENRCVPKIKNRKIRSKVLSCFVSGLFLLFMLTIYLALTLSNRDGSQELHVLLILIVLITTIFFCHSLIRLCMMLIRPPADDDNRPSLQAMIGPGGFANPPEPIRVALARDEEAAGIESDATKVPPPAYGLWRESVRVDPNRIFWQRNLERQTSMIREEGDRPATANRPPSYVSENGIDYVVDAAPRSIAPTTDVPLPPHPSEMGRWPQS